MERLKAGEDIKVKVRLSTTGEDIRLVLNTMETIGMAKKKLQDQEGIQDPSTQRWYYGGKLLGNNIYHNSDQTVSWCVQVTR